MTTNNGKIVRNKQKVFLTSSIYHPYNLKDMDKFSNLLATCLK